MSPRRGRRLAVDELLSYALRSGDSIRIQLRLRDDLDPGDATVRLRAGRRTLEAPARVTRDDRGTLLDCSVTGAAGRRPWQLVLRPSDGSAGTPLEARLLAAPGQPVALLPGPTPATEMAPPAPAPPDSVVRRVARRLPEPVKVPLRKGRKVIAARAR